MIGPDTLTLFPIGRPALAVGAWAGLKSFRKLNEQALRRVVPGLAAGLGIEPADLWSINADSSDSLLMALKSRLM